jgi:phage FluMu gp28-like protein
VRQLPGIVVREADREVGFPTGGTVRVRSADAPDSLRGESLDLGVLDEAAFVPEAVWTEALRPALADRRGRALFLSTPRGRNWFWRAFQRGLDSADPDWRSFSSPTSGNPFIPEGEVEAARSTMPERVFRQEFLAEFSDEAGGVFRGVRECATAERLERARPGRNYVFGVDWGKSNDFTVLVVLDRVSCDMVEFQRFNQIDYALQRGRLMALAERFKPSRIVAEANSIGTPIIEQLLREDLPVEPFITTNASKTAIIDALALAFEKKTVRILSEPALLGELEAFEVERLPSGMLRYAAPGGMHDDAVVALALAFFAAEGGCPPLNPADFVRSPEPLGWGDAWPWDGPRRVEPEWR